MLVLSLQVFFPQDPTLSEWVGAWFIGGNNGGGEREFDSTPLVWVLCATGPSSLCYLLVWFLIIYKRLSIDYKYTFHEWQHVSWLTNDDWSGGRASSLWSTRFLSLSKGKRMGRRKKKGRCWTPMPNWVISVVISHGEHNRGEKWQQSLWEMRLFSKR